MGRSRVADVPDGEPPTDAEPESEPGPESERDPLALARQIADSYRGGGNLLGPRRGPVGPRKVSPRRLSREDPTTLGNVLGDMVRDRGWDERLAAQRVFTDWGQLVGTEVAQHSTVEGYEDGIVRVRTSSTAWAKQLQMLAPTLVAKLNEQLGHGAVIRVEIRGPQAPSWSHGRRSVRGGRGPRDTYG